MVETSFPTVTLIRNRENLGFAKANNLGIRASSGRYISLINSDVKILGNCLDALANYLDHNPQVGLCGPKILNRDLTRQNSCRNFPSLWNNFCQASGLHRIWSRSRLFPTEETAFISEDHAASVDALSGCFWMLRRETWNDVGSLDENFFMYSEDVDWCRRCWNAGWQVIFVPEVEAIHYGGASSANAPARFAVEQQRALLQYWTKHHGSLGRLAIRGILLLGHAIRYGFGVLSRRLRPGQAGRDEQRMQRSLACLKALVLNGQ